MYPNVHWTGGCVSQHALGRELSALGCVADPSGGYYGIRSTSGAVRIPLECILVNVKAEFYCVVINTLLKLVG